MQIPEEITAKKGDLVLPKWEKLLDFISKTGIIPGPGIRINQGPNGTYVYADHFQRPWQSPFKVKVSDDKATIREGSVNGLFPFISEVRISGIDDDGNEVDVPELDVEFLGTNRSAIALVMQVVEGDDIGIVDTPENFYIDHVTDIGDEPEGGTTADLGRVVYPLAFIYWNTDSEAIRKTHQIVHHNLGYRFVQGIPKDGKPVRHFFWAT